MTKYFGIKIGVLASASVLVPAWTMFQRSVSIFHRSRQNHSLDVVPFVQMLTVLCRILGLQKSAKVKGQGRPACRGQLMTLRGQRSIGHHPGERPLSAVLFRDVPQKGVC